jgi:hypothetical protein
MELKHIIFLDIDGVLAGYNFLRTGRGFIDPDKVALINQLKGAEIVISSSWGYDNGRTEKSLRECGLELPIIGYTDHVHFNFEWACRGNEIEKWLLEHAEGMGTRFWNEYLHKDYQEFYYEYVILDDDKDMLLGQIEHFIYVDSKTGLVEADINTARHILKLPNKS